MNNYPKLGEWAIGVWILANNKGVIIRTGKIWRQTTLQSWIGDKAFWHDELTVFDPCYLGM